MDAEHVALVIGGIAIGIAVGFAFNRLVEYLGDHVSALVRHPPNRSRPSRGWWSSWSTHGRRSPVGRLAAERAVDT
jgi:hypothetical protein